MKALWNRIRYSIESDVHHYLDKKEAENPMATLNRFVEEAEQQTEKVQQLLRRQELLVEELTLEKSHLNKQLSKRQDQLVLSEQHQEEELLLFAQDEVKAIEGRMGRLIETQTQAEKDLRALERQYGQMKHKIEDMKMRQLQLMSQENVLRAQSEMEKVEEQTTHLTGDVTSRYFERQEVTASQHRSSMEERLEQLQNQQQHL